MLLQLGHRPAVLGKPADRAEARFRHSRLSGLPTAAGASATDSPNRRQGCLRPARLRQHDSEQQCGEQPAMKRGQHQQGEAGKAKAHTTNVDPLDLNRSVLCRQ